MLLLLSLRCGSARLIDVCRLECRQNKKNCVDNYTQSCYHSIFDSVWLLNDDSLHDAAAVVVVVFDASAQND